MAVLALMRVAEGKVYHVRPEEVACVLGRDEAGV
jgi:hypothetical protein